RLLDGTERVFDGSVSPILMPGGEDMGTVVLFRDVTDEYDREFLTQRFLEELFENLPTAISVIDAHTREVQSVNRAYLELIGLGLDEVVGTRPPYPWWETSFDETEEDWATSERPVRLEGLFRHHEGRLVPVEILRILITGAGGAPERTVSLVTDLSERRRFEQHLVQSGKLAAIGELAAGIAHEINNPLFAILGLVEFLLKETEPGTKPYERLTLIQETGLEIKEIVRALLDFARERSDEFRPVILNEAVSQAAELLRRTSAAKQIDLEERYCDEPLLVNGSPSQLKQILLNLVANARQAMPDGGTITVEVVRDESWALLRVSDTGPGIPPEALGRIFDPFFTTRRDLGGTGLGLSVSLGIAHMHGGELTVSTAAGEGASFTLRLPIVEEVAP
ncbi:MAG: two-component system sensor histidine kinase NtrB, partial [Gaiellaceae bacterium]